MILLDTHVVLWLAFEPTKVSQSAKGRIKEARGNGEGVAISGITLLELAILASKGRFQTVVSLDSFLASVEASFTVIPIMGRACSRVPLLPATYPKDPADRIIGATALAEDLPLVTADRSIIRSKAVRTIW